MSQPNRPSFQKATKSSSAGGASPGGRWGNYSAGVSPVRGLSPVRSNFHGVPRQDIDSSRSHTNPLFSSRMSDVGRMNTPSKAGKEQKENRDKQEQPWKVPVEKAQYSGKTLLTTPVKTPRSTNPSMRFATPPKPVVKRKILAENRDVTVPSSLRVPPTAVAAKVEDAKTGVPPKKEAFAESKPALPKKEVFAESTPSLKPELRSQTVSGSTSGQRSADGNVNSDGNVDASDSGDGDGNGKPKSPLASIEELQKRIQKFLQEEGTTSADSVTAPLSPIHSNDILRRSLPGSTSFPDESSSVSLGLDEASYHPIFAPYSPRPEFIRSRKSPTSVSLDGAVSALGGNADNDGEEKTTPTYDPKNNFLSPRPQYLRYRPLRRLELLRKSAEGLLADLEVDSPATDSSSRQGSEKEDGESQDASQEVSQDVSQEVYSLNLQSSSESPKVSSPKLYQPTGVSSSSSPKLFQPTGVWSSSSPKLFQPTEEARGVSTSELFQPETAETNNGAGRKDYDCVKAPVPVVVGTEEVKAILGSDDVELDDEGEWIDDDGWSFGTRAIATVCSVVSLLALLGLLLVVSGSPGLLPTSLHRTHLSHVWMTSRVTEPVREILQTTEGLWAKGPDLSDFPLTVPIPHTLRVGYMHLRTFVEWADTGKYVRKSGKFLYSSGKFLYSSGMGYGGRLARYVMGTNTRFKESLEDYVDYLKNSETLEVNEWDWVPEYDFVVSHHMFDPVEAYESVVALMESWKVGPFWSSLLPSPSIDGGAKTSSSTTPLLSIEEGTDQNLDSSTESGNSSMCVLPERRVQDIAIWPSSLPAPVACAVPVVTASQIVDPNFPVHETKQSVLISGLESQGLGMTDSIMECSSALDVIVATEVAVDEILLSHDLEEIQLPYFVEEAELVCGVDENQAPHVGEGQLPHVVEEVVLVYTGEEARLPLVVEKIQPPHLVEDVQLVHVEESILSEEELVPSQDCLQRECNGRISQAAAGLSVPSHVMESDTGSSMPLDSTPRGVSQSGMTQEENGVSQDENVASRGEDSFQAAAQESPSLQMRVPSTTHASSPPSFLKRLWPSSPSFHITAVAVIFSLLVVAGAVLKSFHRFNHGFGKRCQPPVKGDSPWQEGFSMFSREPPFTEGNNTLQSLGKSSGSKYLAKYSDSPAVQLSSGFMEQFATPNPEAVYTLESVHKEVIDRDVFSLERSFKNVSDEDLLQSPEMEIVQDSSLGRFTALVPVIHNEGTDKEQVKLTPVRRSSRIRTRMQSPCNSMHSVHHLCSCER